MESGTRPGERLALIDYRGTAFDLIRSLGLSLGVAHVTHADEVGPVSPGTLVMLAVYSGEELDRGHAVYQGSPTVVLGVGTGPREGSRALQLGAVSYIHDGQSPSALRDGIVEGLMRAYRRWSRH